MLGDPTSLATRLFPRVEQSIHCLIVDAFDQWKSGGFPRAGNHENDFTVVLYGCMLRLVEEKGQSYRLVPRIENLEPTANMLCGKSKVNGAPRTDISVLWDLHPKSTYTIECKRIAKGYLSAEYLKEGIHRFLSGKYAPDKRSAAMIGYVIDGRIEVAWNLVNARINGDSTLSKDDKLSPAASVKSLTTVYTSQHTRLTDQSRFVITHFMLDLGDALKT